jgi:hypothetical protein
MSTINGDFLQRRLRPTAKTNMSGRSVNTARLPEPYLVALLSIVANLLSDEHRKGRRAYWIGCEGCG